MGAVVHFGNAANMIMYAVNIYKRVAFLSGNATGMIVYAANIQQVAAVLSGNAAAMIKPAIHHSIPVLFPKWNLDRMITVEAGNYTTMNVTCIRAGVKDLPSGDLVAKARFVAQCLTGNPYFPAPVPSLATLHDATTALQFALVAAEDHARSLVAIRWERHAELERILVQLSKYVMATAQGDVEKQVTSGFELRRPPLRITTLTAPAILTVRRPKSPDGDLLLHWGAVHGARLYQVEMTTDDPTQDPQWTLVHTGSSRSAHIRGLTPCVEYNFRVCAMGTAGSGPYSGVVGEKVR